MLMSQTALLSLLGSFTANRYLLCDLEDISRAFVVIIGNGSGNRTLIFCYRLIIALSSLSTSSQMSRKESKGSRTLDHTFLLRPALEGHLP